MAWYIAEYEEDESQLEADDWQEALKTALEDEGLDDQGKLISLRLRTDEPG
jgi:hypothetical protein